MDKLPKQIVYLLVVGLGVQVLSCAAVLAAVDEKPVERSYAPAPEAPASQDACAVVAKSAGCRSCHIQTDAMTMHDNPAVKLGCTDCHGGDATVFKSDSDVPGAYAGCAGVNARIFDLAEEALESAHVLPQYPESWHYPSSANPVRSYTLLNRESAEFIRFVNPSDYRVADKACGACHQEVIEASKRSLHSTGAMFWGGASYNNGILDNKVYAYGEAYDAAGRPIEIKSPALPPGTEAAARQAGILPSLRPLPAWETVKPGDIFRVFERGGRNIVNLFPETGIPNALGQLQRIEEPGRPDFRQSNRGPGTGARIAVPFINVTKTRLNDPFTWFIGTNDQPGDYRQSGCASCHVVYANDRDEKHSAAYAAFGHDGMTRTVDPTIPKDESGHPLQHRFTRAIPTSQCMICHMHQPNMFLNSYLGYTMWDYESDAPAMWPEQQQYPSIKQTREVLDRNPEGAAPRGKWADVGFLKGVWDMNDGLTDTQFADYHGHGWNFRAIFKRDRKGNLLDADGNIVSPNNPDKFNEEKGGAVHLSSIHMKVGMHCVDCHYSQDNHGNGYIQGEVAHAVEIDCKDCHGTIREYPNLYASGPAALEGGTDLLALRTPDGRRRFEWVGEELRQRSMLYPEKEWKVSLVKDTVTLGSQSYNARAARAKLMGKDTHKQEWSSDLPAGDLAHSYDDMECYTCHTSWTTSCGGCHLPIEANWKTERHHYEGGESRNYATYNPQVARDQMFLIGRRGPGKGSKIAPVRSSSALVLSSTNANREKIYVQQPPIAASGYSSQAFNPHFPHTVRKTETRQCSDCHLSDANDNNAIMAQLLMLGTNFVNFVGYHAYAGGDGEINAIQVTEWDEPQAVIGSYLHKYAYPDWYKMHQERGEELQTGYRHGAGVARCLQLRGEYLFVAEGKKGFRVYDVAGIGNKGISQRIITAPFAPPGQDTHISSNNATCVALPTNQPINPYRNNKPGMQTVNQEQPIHPLYNYAYVVDAQEGLILVDVNTLADGEPRNNRLRRALTWNPDAVLAGARHITIGGNYLYITTDYGLAIVDISSPMAPALVGRLRFEGAHSTALQFRYLFLTDRDGLKVIDVTDPAQAVLVPDNQVTLQDARRVYVARTYAYVAAGSDGLVIVDVEKAEQMSLLTSFTAGGRLRDSHDVIVATTNASLFAYVADGMAGLKVIQLTSPRSQPNFYGFSPEPRPELIAQFASRRPMLSLSKGLDRDRGVDESGNQIAVFGRLGSRPLNVEEMKRLYLDEQGRPWHVRDTQ